jgi:hypothetical protein
MALFVTFFFLLNHFIFIKVLFAVLKKRKGEDMKIKPNTPQE